ncbi:MAG: hypothetical protein ACI4R8_00890 [Candidatus Caccovivens sp.]
MQLNRELIEGLNEGSNSEFAGYLNEVVENLFAQVISDVSTKSPFIRTDKCVLLPVGENYSGAICQLSEYSYILAIENPQMEHNSKLKKNWWKLVWREFRASWRIGRKKKYKKQKSEPTLETLEKYKISDFRHDVVMNLANYLSESSIIHEYSNSLSVIGKEDFGSNVKINVLICMIDATSGNLKIFKENKNKFYSFSFGNRYRNLEQKKREIGSQFVELIKLFNVVYSKKYDKIPNQILIESLVYNCPKILFDKNDLFKTFVNVVNYVRLKNPKSITSICDEGKNIFEEPLIIDKNSQIEYSKVISMLDNFNY